MSETASERTCRGVPEGPAGEFRFSDGSSVKSRPFSTHLHDCWSPYDQAGVILHYGFATRRNSFPNPKLAAAELERLGMGPAVDPRCKTASVPAAKPDPTYLPSDIVKAFHVVEELNRIGGENANGVQPVASMEVGCEQIVVRIGDTVAWHSDDDDLDELTVSHCIAAYRVQLCDGLEAFPLFGEKSPSGNTTSANAKAAMEIVERAKANRDLNSDHDESRALHRVVRAMHDGECPKCHQVHASNEMWQEAISMPLAPMEVAPSGWQCPACGFYVTEGEGEQVFRIFAPFMENNLAAFEKWRAGRYASPLPPDPPAAKVEAEPTLPNDDRPIWERMSELAAALPQEVIANLPTDGASQVDHYVYGTPKRPVEAEREALPGSLTGKQSVPTLLVEINRLREAMTAIVADARRPNRWGNATEAAVANAVATSVEAALAPAAPPEESPAAPPALVPFQIKRVQGDEEEEAWAHTEHPNGFWANLPDGDEAYYQREDGWRRSIPTAPSKPPLPSELREWFDKRDSAVDDKLFSESLPVLNWLRSNFDCTKGGGE